ncbi:MAG: TatD family hydrolase [Parcubacteria group bacterium]|nr:TatD family hydrolase [Parcubacteria group bacterium]MCR4342484.1 TatD family hydrolase [Patescibacteria group bacterium]
MKPKLFDIHSHLNFPEFDNDREEIIKKMQAEGIFTIVVGTDKETSKSAIKLAESASADDNLFASVGLHPTDKEDGEFSAQGGPVLGWDYGYYKKIAMHPKVVAIGECGIDLFRRERSDLKRQEDVFRKHVKLALEIDKPLMIHCRDAHNEVLEILNSYFLIHGAKLRGNIHFFSGDIDIAQRYFDLGFSISFAGVITFSRDYDEVIKRAPLERIMIETDSPFVAPAPYRGKRNEPLYVKEVAKKIAEIRGISYEEVSEITTENALRMFYEH